MIEAYLFVGFCFCGVDCVYHYVYKVVERLKLVGEGKQFLAMYSSVVGGITTDPAAMVLPLDDHMVHRGHGVFDTAMIVNGSVS